MRRTRHCCSTTSSVPAPSSGSSRRSSSGRSRETVEDSDVFSESNARFAECLNTGDECQIYPAQEAEIEEEAVYVLRDEFDVTPPEGDLVTAELDRVDEEDLNDVLEVAPVGETNGGNVTGGGNETNGNLTDG